MPLVNAMTSLKHKIHFASICVKFKGETSMMGTSFGSEITNKNIGWKIGKFEKIYNQNLSLHVMIPLAILQNLNPQFQ